MNLLYFLSPVICIIIMWYSYKYCLKNIVYITTNSENIQKKVYRIKRKNILSAEFNEGGYLFIVKTKKYIYEFEFIYDALYGIEFIKMLKIFNNMMEDVFIKKYLNSIKIHKYVSCIKLHVKKNDN